MGLATIDKITAQEVLADLDLQRPADWPGAFSINTG
jgi:hypothetical protein